MNISGLESISDVLQTIGPIPRLQILMAIGRGEPCVCHLEATFGWRQAYLSQHLMAMRKAGIIVANRKGRNIHYRLADPRLLQWIRKLAVFQGVTLPELAPSPKCACPNCGKEKRRP